MNKLSICFAAALLTTQGIGFVPLSAATSYQASTSSINWTTDYQAALQKASQENKAVVLFFTGSDWCTWCHKLEKEVLNTPKFAELVGNKFVFVTVDFPKRGQIDGRTKQQNDQLLKKFNVTGYPTLVLVDSKENVIGTTGYQQGGPEKYADHLNEIVGKAPKTDDFQTLKAEYQQTKDTALLERGLKVDQGNFFAKEKYSRFVQDGKMYEPQAKFLKENLLKSGSSEAHYHIAMVEFKDLSGKQEQQVVTSNDACSPLIEYLEKHGSTDKDAWRIEATVAECFYGSKQYEEALKWATVSLDHAPAEFKPAIEKLISTIEADQKNSPVQESTEEPAAVPVES